MATIDETAVEVANTLVDELGQHSTTDDRDRDHEIARLAAIRMSHRLNMSIELDDFFERTIEFQTKAVTLAEGHIQVIILAGYAAYFALWSTMAAHIPSWAMLASGALMLISVIVFVGWTVAGLVFAKVATERTMKVYNDGPIDFWTRCQEAERKNLAGRQRLMKFWQAIVACAGVTALAAAVLLAATSGMSFVDNILEAKSENSEATTLLPTPPCNSH